MPTAPPVDLHAAAAELGVHYQTAYRWVRTGRLPAVKVAGRYQVDRSALERFAHDRAAPSAVPTPGPRRLSGQAERMHEALVAGDDTTARRIARRLDEEGATISDVITEVLSPPLQRIGQAWREGELSIWVEHRATAIVERILGELTPTPRGRRRGTVVVAAVSGDLHALPTAMAAAALRADNWQVEHLGADVPPEELVHFCAAHDVSVVALSLTNVAVADVAEGLAATLRGAGTPVVLGGAGRSLDDLVAEVREAVSH
ncbi:cobalamin-dependent protein [Nocardioides psychrotolerans]|uniref:cobalamin-dependent protein n=1 Tax=Nocardioides psychrotolerans TaxID=1005945 RepID=UPI0031379928